jgi:hypothetical protein
MPLLMAGDRNIRPHPTPEIFMYRIAGWVIVIISAMAGYACDDPVGPGNSMGQKPSVAVERSRRPAISPVPDSVGIPPVLPPIYEELPSDFDGTQ